MEASPGARLAALLHTVFELMVDEVVVELDRQGHPGVTATLEFALVGIDQGAEDASSLGRHLGVSKQAAAKSIASLEELGYVSREPDPADGRRKRLVVTARGGEMTSVGAAAFDRLRLRWIEAAGTRDVEAAEAALVVLLADLRAAAG